MSYLKEAVKGVTWMVALRVSTRLITLTKVVILARLLTPDQFGVFGVATLVMAFLEVITETGVNVFFIQGEGKIKDYLNTAWIVTIVRGLIIALIILFTAPLVSAFFNSQQTKQLLMLTAAIPLIKGFINPAIVKFQKELQFNKEFFIRFIIFVFDAVIAIIVSTITRSASGLIWGLITGTILEVFLSFLLVKPRPRLVFELTKIKKVFVRGKWITAYGIFNYFFHQGDDVVVGRLLGTNSLGFYQVAYKISTFPITEVADVFAKVAFPIYVRIASDSSRLKKAFVKTTLGISALVIPLGLIIFFFAKEIVLIVLGDNWLSLIPLLKVLSIFGVVRSISGSSSTLFLALKKQEYVTTVTFTSIISLAIFIVPLVLKYKTIGAGFSALIGSVMALPVIIYYLLKIF